MLLDRGKLQGIQFRWRQLTPPAPGVELAPPGRVARTTPPAGGASVWAAMQVALPPPLGPGPALFLVAFFVAVINYDTWAFVQEARRTRGVTRRRMQAAALGSACIALVLILAGVQLNQSTWA